MAQSPAAAADKKPPLNPWFSKNEKSRKHLNVLAAFLWSWRDSNPRPVKALNRAFYRFSNRLFSAKPGWVAYPGFSLSPVMFRLRTQANALPSLSGRCHFRSGRR